MIGLVLVLAALIAWRITDQVATTPESIRSIAVLPLNNLMGDPDQEYFVDGMHEALITELSRISALKVISRQSTLGYKGTEKTSPEIARELDVDAVVAGSVLREGDTVRTTVQLIHGPTDRNLWAQSFDRELSGILALQSEVAAAIASQISVTLTPQEQTRLAAARPIDPEAYELYLKGRFSWHELSTPSIEKSIEFVEQAIEIDPEFALAYAWLVELYAIYGQMARLPRADYVPKMKQAALKALEIDEMMGEAHASLALILMAHEWDWAGAEREYERAIQLNPNHAMAHLSYSALLSIIGRHEEAVAQNKLAQGLDPLNAFIAMNVGFRYYYSGNQDQALVEIEKALERFPDDWANRWVRGMIFCAKGMYAEAVAEFQKAVDLDEGSLVALPRLGYALARAGRKAEAEKVLAVFEAESKHRHVPAYYFYTVYSGLGEKDRAFEWMEKSFQKREPTFAYNIAVDPLFDSLREDPRFEDLLQRLDLPAI